VRKVSLRGGREMDLPESAGLNDKFWHRLFEWLNVRFPLIVDIRGHKGRH